jgi:hypothetical protein
VVVFVFVRISVCLFITITAAVPKPDLTSLKASKSILKNKYVLAKRKRGRGEAKEGKWKRGSERGEAKKRGSGKDGKGKTEKGRNRGRRREEKQIGRGK